MNFCIVGKVRTSRTNLVLDTAACFQIQQLNICSYIYTPKLMTANLNTSLQ